jgi:hypothetical protein
MISILSYGAAFPPKIAHVARLQKARFGLVLLS